MKLTRNLTKIQLSKFRNIKKLCLLQLDRVNFFNKNGGTNRKLNYLRNILKNKVFLFYLLFFLIGNIGLYVVTYNDQRSLAVNEKIFESTLDLSTANLENLLIDKFNLEPHISTEGYNNYTSVFLILILGIELFAIVSTFLLWKRSSKRFLLFRFLGLQLLIMVPLFIPTITPSHVINDLNKKAKIDIDKQIMHLSSDEGRNQLSIMDTSDEIKDAIIQSSILPKIIDEQVDNQALIQSLQIQDKDTLYRVVILPKYVLTQESLGLNFDSYLFPNNTLVIKKASKDLLANILPVLVGKIVDNEVGESLKDKKEAKFSILSDDAYNIIQTQKSEKIKDELLGYINGFKSYLADANKYIPILQSDKKSLEEERVSYKIRTDSFLSECRASYEIEDCKPVEDVINKNIASIEDDLKIINDKLQGWLDVKPKLTYGLQVTQASYEKFLKFPITPELQAGVFNPPDNVYLKYYSEGEDLPPPSEYLNVGLHEYLHYQAYNSEGSLPSFLDEALTDYLANKMTKKYSFRKDIQTHYPEEIAIIQELLKTVPESKLLSAYFNQSELEIEKLIDSNYSKGTYKKMKDIGEALTYIDPTDQQAKEQVLKEIISLLSISKKQ